MLSARSARQHRCSLCLLALVVSSVTLGCRANEDSCTQLASHIAALAKSEGKGGAGTALALERDCNEHRPTRKLVRCMMDAQSLADVDAC